jgi:hypothetical protein
MKRRDFVKTTSVLPLTLSLPSLFHCNTKPHHQSAFPKCPKPENLVVVDMSQTTNWYERTIYTCLQGLVNKGLTSIYLNYTKNDRFWLAYYQERFNVSVEAISSPAALLKKYKDQIAGYILYEKDNPHTLNLATSLGGIHNAIPVEKELEHIVKSQGLKKVDDLTGRFNNIYDCYEWAIKNVLPQCNKKFVAQLCVHYPAWPTSSFANRDYVIANKMFCFDLSTSERDKKEFNMIKRIYQQLDEGTMVMGWHCVRDKEHEAIALSSEFGHYGMCSLHTPNLTVHSSIQLEPGKKFKQRPPAKNTKVENKVYVAYMATDGDASWFMLDHINKDWASPAHGKFKYNWGFLPLAYDLMPGTVQYYIENALPNDYFAAGPAGATYTYPHLHPNPEKFLQLSADYMDKCGLTTVHMTNWNDRDWWQELDLPDMPTLLRDNIPNAVGFVRGMGESAFEPHYLKDGLPYIFCGEGIHRGNDIYQVMRDFIDACPNRPLFIYNLVNHSIPMHEVKAAMDRFSSDEIEMVHLDELLLLAQQAYKEGKITEDLYPQKDGLKKILAKEAQATWLGFVEQMSKMNDAVQSGKSGYEAWIKKSSIGLEPFNTAEILAFQTIWNGMTMVKLSLESRGIYVNHKPTATKTFLKEFANIPESNIVNELQKLWDKWHDWKPEYKESESLYQKLYKLTDKVNRT